MMIEIITICWLLCGRLDNAGHYRDDDNNDIDDDGDGNDDGDD